MNLRRALAKNVRKWRTEHGLTQEQFADLIGLHSTYVSQIECEKRGPSIDVLQRLAEAMNISPADLFSD